MSYHHQTLELHTGASEAEIKKAYRRLARKYHPDVSIEENAKDKFIEITEAYDQLFNPIPVYTPSQTEYTQEVDEEMYRRERAQQYANMRYQDFKRNNLAFKKAWYYSLVKTLTYFLVGFCYLFAFLISISGLLMWYFFQNIPIIAALIMTASIGTVAFKQAIELHKGVKPYFSDYY